MTYMLQKRHSDDLLNFCAV